MNGQRRLILFFFANALFAAGLGFQAFLYNFYLEGLGHSPIVMGRAAAMSSLGGLLVLLPMGRAVDRWGPKPAIVGASLTAALGIALSAFVSTETTIYLAAALTGTAGVTWRVALSPVMMELSTTRNRSRLFTWDIAILVGAGAAATAISGALAERLASTLDLTRLQALTVTIVVGAVLTGASALIYASLDLDPPKQMSAPEAGSAPVPATTVALIALSGLWVAALTLAAPFFNVYFTRTFHLSIERVSWIFSAATITTAVLLAGAGELAARLGVRQAFVIWLALFGPAMWGLAMASSVGLAAACYLLQTLVSPAANPLLDQLLLESVPISRRGTVSSWRQAFASGGLVLAQSTGGVVLTATSFATLFTVAGAAGLIAGGAVALVVFRLPRSA